MSLLFYVGLLTVCEVSFVRMGFDIPNRVIAELYYTYFREVLAEQPQLTVEAMDMAERVVALAREDDMGPVVEALQQVRSYWGHPDVVGWFLTVVGHEVHVERVDL